MYPNQQNPRPGGSYPQQQPPYNAGGAYPQQQPLYGNPPPHGGGPGMTGGYQPNMSAPYGSNPYGQGSNPQGGNPYGQSGYGAPGGNTGAGGYPPPGQQSYGSNPYGQNPSGMGSGYPPQGGAYPPQGGAYPPQGGAYPPQGGAYPPQGGGYPGQQPSYPPPQGGYPGGPPGGGYGAPGAGGVMPNDQRNQRLNQVIQQYQINPQFAARLQALANCEIVVLCDDSGSMNTPLQHSGQTRWDELKSIVNTVVDIAATMDANGVDVYFLNRDSAVNVTNAQSIRQIFNSPPNGLTPLVPALRRILAAKRSLSYEKKLLILVATDGAPTNEQGQVDVASLEAVLRQERTPQTYVTFLACTDDLNAVSYLSNWDKSMPNLDVIDDYASERAEIQRTRGGNFPFSNGDYVVKALLGSIDPWFDSLDG